MRSGECMSITMMYIFFSTRHSIPIINCSTYPKNILNLVVALKIGIFFVVVVLLINEKKNEE